MLNRLFPVVLLSTLCAPLPQAFSQVYVWQFEPGNPAPCPTPPTGNPPGPGWSLAVTAAIPGDPIGLNVDGCISAFWIYALHPSQAIGHITIQGAGSPPSVSVTLKDSISGPAEQACGDFGGLTVTNATVRGKVHLNGWIAGNLNGGIDVGSFNMQVDGSVNAAMRSRTGSGVLVAGSTSSSGTLYADQGTIGASVAGTIAGNITSAAGKVGTITCNSLQAHVTANVASGSGIDGITVTNDIGSPSNVVNITAVGNIRVVTAANIWANISVTGANRELWRVQTTGAGSTAGNFTGSITAPLMPYPTATGATPRLLIEGTLDANVTFASYAAAPLHDIGSIPAGRTLSIGGGWYNPRVIEIGTLAGQVILNSTNNPLLEWTGPVKVDGTTLSPTPDYANLSSSLGGGAVGFAPFRLHKEDCIPVHGASILGPFPDGDNAVMIRHYGPVFWTTGMPVTVEYQTPGAGSWKNITSDFNVSAGPTDRDIIVWPATPLDFDGALVYRIRPVRTGTNALKCQDVTGNPPVADYTYTLNLY